MNTSATPVSAAAQPSARPRRGLLLFFAVAFGSSWLCWAAAIAIGGSPTSGPAAVPYLLGAFGPTLAAIAVRIHRGRRYPAPAHRVRSRFRRLGWVPLLLVLASATVLGGALLAHQLFGGPAVTAETARKAVAAAGGAAPFLVSMVVSGPISEEPGWRGTAYPRLRGSMGRLTAGLVLGVVWAVWHAPLFFVHGTVQHQLGITTVNGLLFFLSTVPMALLTAYAYERAGVVASAATHFAVNTTMILVGVSAASAQTVIMVVQALVAIPLLAAHRRRTYEPATGGTSAPQPAAAPSSPEAVGPTA